MVQALIAVPLVLVVIAVLVATNRHHRRESAKFARECRRFWWGRRKQDRDDLLDTARSVTARGEFRHRRPSESPWSYAKAFDRWSAKQLKTKPTAQWSKPYDQTSEPLRLPPFPRLPRLPRLPRIAPFMAARSDMVTWSSVQIYWWATEHGGLIHRAVALRHDHGESFVLRCDHDVLLEPTQVEQYPDGQGPLLTCVRCFGMPRV